MSKQDSLLEVAWKIFQRGDTVLLLSLICLLPNDKLTWPKQSAK